MIGKTCDARMYRGPCDCKVACELCRVGCNRLARHKNPFFGKEFGLDGWRGWYSYAEYLCAECYDRMVSDAKDWDKGRPADPEYTKILETL